MLIALVVILLLFGAKKIPELARGLGSGVREFKAGTREDPKVKDEKKKNEELPEAEESEKTETSGRPETHLEEDASIEADKAEQKQH
jgi:sec-independent protein translocase protein TatA